MVRLREKVQWEGFLWECMHLEIIVIVIVDIMIIVVGIFCLLHLSSFLILPILLHLVNLPPAMYHPNQDFTYFALSSFLNLIVTNLACINCDQAVYSTNSGPISPINIHHILLHKYAAKPPLRRSLYRGMFRWIAVQTQMRRVRTQLETRSKVERMFVLACQRGAESEVGWSRRGLGLLMVRAGEGGGILLESKLVWISKLTTWSLKKKNCFLVYKA